MSLGQQQLILPLHQRLRGIVFSQLARASAWLLVGSIAGGILGYAFQVIMARMLTTQDYGVFSAMMAVFGALTAPLGALLMVISRKVSEYRVKEDVTSMTHFYYSINIRSAIVGAVFLVFWLVFARQLQLYLKAPSLLLVYLLAALLFLNFLPIINSAFLQGLQKFTWLSASNLMTFGFRIIFSTSLIWLGYGVAGAVGGTIFSSLLIWFITYRVLTRSLVGGDSKTFQTAHLSFKSAIPVLIANASFAVMTQLDLVQVNYYFSSHEAGIYAAASILGKAVMYLPGGIVMALFPMVAESHAREEGSTHLLLQALGIVTVLCGASAIFYYFFGDFLIHLLYGERYLEAGIILRYYGFAMLPMTLVMVAEYFLIAKGRVMFAYLFLGVAPLEALAIYWHHETLLTVVSIMTGFGSLLAVVGLLILWRAFRLGGSKT